jgi:hypothetical protein
MAEQTARELLQAGYKTTEQPKKQEQTHVVLKEADDSTSAVHLISWGYRKLTEEANADNQND